MVMEEIQAVVEQEAPVAAHILGHDHVDTLPSAEGRQVRRLMPAENQRIVPGDEVIFTVTFTNISAESADNVTITNPVPDHMRLVAGSAVGPGTDITFSVDGGQTYGLPDELTVADATLGSRPATADDYTHIRWRMQNALQPGAKGFARFRAVLR